MSLPASVQGVAAYVTQTAAIACLSHVGMGKKDEADQAAVDAMRRAFDECAISGTIVIGEGERDEAPMLYIGEEVGGGGTPVHIAVDPLEGTDICASGGPGALAVLAMAAPGDLLNAPDVYMQKLAVGPGYNPGLCDLDAPIGHVVQELARQKGVPTNQIRVMILERDRHQELIAEVRAVGASVMLIGDGDVAAILAAADPASPIDLYVGSGGAPEGVLAAAALKSLGGQMSARLLFRNAVEKERADKWGITDLNRIYQANDLAKGDAIFAATGVTSGGLLSGVAKTGTGFETQTLILHAGASYSARITAQHSA